MNTHGENERLVLPVEEIELFFPHALDHVRVDVAVGRGLLEGELEGRPVVEVPVCRDLDDAGWGEGGHGRHP